MTQPHTYQQELKNWLDDFRSDAGLPKKAVTLSIVAQKLIVQYEPKDSLPNVEKMRQSGKQLAVVTGTGAVIAGGAAMLVGRTLLGGALARIGIAGAFGAVGLGLLGPAILVGGTAAGVGYAVYQVGRNKAQNEQARSFGEDLLAHLQEFRPANPPPPDMAIATSSDRRITVVYDPELGI